LRDELSISKTDEKTVMTADRGYFSVENIKQEGQGIELLIAARREGKEESTERKDGVYWLERFEYIKESDSWRCPTDGFWCERRSKYSMGGRSFGDTNALIVKSAYLGDIV